MDPCLALSQAKQTASKEPSKRQAKTGSSSSASTKKKVFESEWIFAEKEIIFYGFTYFVVLGVCWALWKNWPNAKGMRSTRRLLLWSPVFRIVMMTWFATALWVFSMYNGYNQNEYNLENPKVIGKGVGRQLGALDTKYPTIAKFGFW